MWVVLPITTAFIGLDVYQSLLEMDGVGYVKYHKFSQLVWMEESEFSVS